MRVVHETIANAYEMILRGHWRKSSWSIDKHITLAPVLRKHEVSSERPITLLESDLRGRLFRLWDCFLGLCYVRSLLLCDTHHPTPGTGSTRHPGPSAAGRAPPSPSCLRKRPWVLSTPDLPRATERRGPRRQANPLLGKVPSHTSFSLYNRSHAT